jgi:hypothetical protein
MPCCMQEWKRKWPAIMTTGHIFHRGPVGSGPWFTIVQQGSTPRQTAGGVGVARGGVGGGYSAKIRKEPGFKQFYVHMFSWIIILDYKRFRLVPRSRYISLTSCRAATTVMEMLFSSKTK